MSENQPEKSGSPSWVWPVIKGTGTCVFLFFSGHWTFNWGWVILPAAIGLMVLHERNKHRQGEQKKRNWTVASLDRNMLKELFTDKSLFKDVPSWVNFPDMEPAEWLNQILLQVWPNVNHYVRETIKDMEPAICEVLKPYKMSGFHFTRIILGSEAPRVGGVKVYARNTSREEIVMDMEILYAGDCDIQLEVMKFGAGVKDVQLRGVIRLVMKPLINTIPLVGGVNVFFLNQPTIDFDLVGLGEALEFPGLNGILHEQVNLAVATMMVLPNKYSLKLSDDFPMRVLKFTEPAGVVRVKLVEARDLVKKDIGLMGKGKSDPYAKISIGAQEHTSQVIDNNINPIWNFTCEFVCSEIHGQVLVLESYDHDSTSKANDFLGRASINIDEIRNAGTIDQWLKLEEVKSGRIHIQATWFNLTPNEAVLSDQLEMTSGTTQHSSVLTCFVDSARSLPNAKRSLILPNPKVKLVVGRQSSETWYQYHNSNPVWEETFSFLVHNPYSDELKLTVVDSSSDEVLGSLDVSLAQLLKEPNMEYNNVPFSLKYSANEAQIVLTLQLRILTLATSEASSESNAVAGSENVSTAITEETDESHPSSSQDTSSQNNTTISPGAERVSPQPAQEATKPLNKNLDTAKSSGSDSPLQEDVQQETKSEDNKGVNEPPSIDETLMASMAPVLESVNMDPNNVETELRRRKPRSSDSVGRIKLTLRYTPQRSQLVIVVHQVEIVDVPQYEEDDLPDPYVKLYLLPDRSKESKRKTDVIKDNIQPVYDETFEYPIQEKELPSRSLEVQVISKKGMFARSPVLGQVVLELKNYDLRTTVADWFDLQRDD